MNEQQYLEKVENLINSFLASYGDDVLELKEYIREERQRMWNDFVRDSCEPDMFELVQITQTEQLDEHRFTRIENEHAVMSILSGNPYFARLDFEEDGDAETVYIGRRSLIDPKTSDVLVCDWRADISSMYYEYEPGPAKYKCPVGDIDCNLLLKRQFKIENGKLLYMFDSDVAIEDEVLQSELGKTSDNRLKSIISTIQKEQNSVIRNSTDRLLLVSGVAGSGKTSVALHRLAYLLYKYHGSLSSNEIMIFSPNNVFNNFIAEVLPDLGENKVIQTSFYEYFSAYFGGFTSLDGASQAEASLNGSLDPSTAILKGSREFLDFLTDHFRDLAPTMPVFEDFDYYGASVRTAEEQKQLFFDVYSSFPYEIRKNKILDGIDDYMEQELRHSHTREYERELTEGGIISYSDEELDIAIEELWQKDKKEILDRCASDLSVNVVSVYLSALKSFDGGVYEKTAQRINDGILDFEDLLALAYLKIIAGQIRVQRGIKHVVIDEAQDYPPILYKAVSLLFPNAAFTVVGDPGQALIMHYSDLERISDSFALDKKRYVHLTKSYRCTVEINEFISSLVKNDADYSFYERHGEDVTRIAKQDLCSYILSTSDNGMSTRAVICKTEADCENVVSFLKENGVNAKIVGRDGLLYNDRILVIPCSLIKGLEFDEVFIWSCDGEWTTLAEKHALFVGASRALHKLNIVG